MSTGVDIRPGMWVKVWHDDTWRYVLAARHTPWSPSEPRTTGYVQYDAVDEGGRTFGGFATHDEHCNIRHDTPTGGRQ